ncbi:hypothetical protein QUF90_03540 [Desulfococcaceae bacterium HSG9]|nr:hypothetical protein [Desulfococcaceae bacterium HSG9]
MPPAFVIAKHKIICVSLGKKAQWSRAEAATKVVDFEKAETDLSQRRFAKTNGIPRSTLQHRIARKKTIDECPEYVNFSESPHGLAFLHRMITVAFFAFCKVGDASNYNPSEFIRLAGPEKSAAASSSHYLRVSAKTDDAVIEFGKSECETSAALMPFKRTALAEDE